MINVENNIDAAKESFLKAARAAAKESKITLIADVQSVTPVDTGSLRRSITGICRATDSEATITVGSPLIYAKKVEFQDKSYLRSTLMRDFLNVGNVFTKHIRGANYE
ncbi:HK97 gp10 family phage protein [Clostridium perfringens]|uniref:HK97 gp10 family phage protein n=1 Tax=Clostridium perfringens TaxID=1502 RepID=UPI0039E8B162